MLRLVAPVPAVLAAAGIAVGVLLAAPAACADEPDAEALRAAAAEFDLGDRAFQRRDYEVAAAHFEAAFQRAPHPDALELAIKARLRAGALARAATLAAMASERYPERRALASLTRGALDEARKKLQDLVLVCTPACALAIDGRLVWRDDVDRFHVFVDPGSHTVVATFAGTPARTKSAALHAVAGASDTLVLEPPASPPPAPASASLPASPTSPGPPGPAADTGPTPRRRKPFGPVPFWIGVGLTALGGVATGASGAAAAGDPGADVVRARCAGLGTACPEYQAGEAGELRTNVLLVSTIVVAAATAATGLFLTEF